MMWDLPSASVGAVAALLGEALVARLARRFWRGRQYAEARAARRWARAHRATLRTAPSRPGPRA